ncbi:BLUF domain-containing protein [Aquimarina muelleri]|uniref:BLUF domain-containing protein n=1 Tax=Aquimarina muelleri TaxID=279356 RepID=A0A918JSP0_9FLAO|nr:BLUF domain-containing protein [Aquimarina muelleri]MCX2763103.1 BLUF domain-containing protein [Aquimarina muelleri]GGX06646.1 hypothetical protein GCM10007384_05450 [Aquimarina muelleri]
MRYVISYVSTATSKISSYDIAQLMDLIKTNNNKLNIIGILIYSDRNFFQILEGEKHLVKMIFNKIKKDARHYNIIKMLDKEIKTPTLRKYNPSFTVISDHYNQKELQQFLNKEKTNNPEHFDSISYLTKKFMKLT